MEFDFRLGDSSTAYFRPRLFTDILDGDNDRFEPYELYVTEAGDGWDLRAGQFVENWGIADTFNPIDVINRRDLATGILDTKRMGEIIKRLDPKAKAAANAGAWQFHIEEVPVVVVPLEAVRVRESRIPAEESVGWFRPPDSSASECRWSTRNLTEGRWPGRRR